MSRPSSELRIAHVVTLVSPDGAYGGPLRVAVGQVAELVEMGHEVTLLGGFRGFERAPKTYEGVPVRLFRARRLIPRAGFAGLWSPALMFSLFMTAHRYDVIHVHLARDLVSLVAARIALFRGCRVMVQTHGMVDASTKRSANLIDLLLTRPVLRRASSVFVLNPDEKADLEEVAGAELKSVGLRNGIRLDAPASPVDRADQVLFLARLHPRKRPVAFVRSSIALAEEFPNVQFVLVGPDEGEGQAVQELIASSRLSPRVRWEGPLELSETQERMKLATIFVAPAVNEPFGMSVLEAMNVGLPVVVTESCGLSPSILSARAGLVIGDAVEALTAAIRHLLIDPGMRAEMGDNARALASEFSMTSVAATLQAAYRGELLDPGLLMDDVEVEG